MIVRALRFSSSGNEALLEFSAGAAYFGNVQSEYREAVSKLVERSLDPLGDRLVAVVLYGSVAKGRARPDSDVDVLLVVRDLPAGVRARRQLIAAALDESEAAVQRNLPDAWISAVLKTPAEVERGGPLFYDMTVPGEAEILHDPSGFFRRFLEQLRARMAALGSQRRSYLGHSYWDLKPDWKPGDVIDL
jgi:predicted nucleotidyltransferase